MATTAPRVLVVDDDPAMRLYVATALQHLEIDLVLCASVAQALAMMGTGPVRLVVTDLLLAGESGTELIDRLQRERAVHGPLRIAVASASLDTPGMVERLQRLGVWRMLRKPLSLEAIESCVIDALRDAPPLRADEAVAPLPQPKCTADVVKTLFDGDEPLYRAYRRECLQQFPLDIEEGDRHHAAGDAAALRRIAHNLHSVLQTLGEAQSALHAHQLETALIDGEAARAARFWQALRACLAGLGDEGVRPITSAKEQR